MINHLSPLNALFDVFKNHPIVEKVFNSVLAEQSRRVTFLWITDYAGIPGNGLAHQTLQFYLGGFHFKIAKMTLSLADCD